MEGIIGKSRMLIVDNQGLLLSGLLTVIMIISAPPVWSEPIDDVRVVVGGLVRLGYYKLDKSPRPTYQTSLKHDERDIENHLAKNLFAKWYYLRFGIGYRWLSYELEGSGEDVDQTLALNFFVPTFSVFLLDGHALHPKVNTRIGLIYGKGNSTTELDTKSSESSASETIDQTDKSSGDVEYEI